MRTYTQEEKQAVIDRVIMYRKVKGDIMTTSKIPTATTIPLEPIENEHFFAVVIPEQNSRWQSNVLWIFRVGCGVALMASSHRSNDPTPVLIVDGIRTRDIMGEFDHIKEELLGMR